MATDGASAAGRDPRSGPAAWPTWARRVVSAALIWHGAAILAGIWAAPPASDLERSADDLFEPYDSFIRQGFSYRYYAVQPPTPVITATLSFRDGRPEQTVRIPYRATRPRLLYQRELNLANWLMDEVNAARQHTGDPGESHWARAFATHLGRTHPGCSGVTLRNQFHLVPPLDRVRDELAHPRLDGKPVDLDADEFYTTPERIGVFPCDAS